MNEDRYFSGLLYEHLEREERFNQLYDEECESLINDLKDGLRTDEFDLCDYLYDYEDNLLMALASGNDAEVVGIIRRVYEKQLHGIVLKIVEDM